MHTKLECDTGERQRGHSGFSLHHSAIQFQQNTWPHGVAVGCCRGLRHSGHLLKPPISGKDVEEDDHSPLTRHGSAIASPSSFKTGAPLPVNSLPNERVRMMLVREDRLLWRNQSKPTMQS